MKRRVALVVLIVGLVVLWRPLLRPLGAGSIVVADIYSSALWDRNLAALVTPPPRVSDSSDDVLGSPMRITWWTPGWGDRHAAVMLVNGATQLGNDDPETRRLGEALARGGYLVMLPEFAFIKEGRFDARATAYLDAAFARLLARPDASGMPHGAFGFSVGGGLLLAAATRPALRHATYLGALGAYFDLDTYLAAVVSGTQRRAGQLEPWDADAEVRLRLPVAVAEALADPTDRARVTDALRAGAGHLSAAPPNDLGAEAVSLWSALASSDYEPALERIRALPASLRAIFDEVSPRTAWSTVRPPAFWLHDVGDRFEPVSEAETAASIAHAGPMRLQLTALLSHAAALGAGARAKGLDFWFTELSGLLSFATAVQSEGL
jgi:hypothetical protein